MRELSTRLLREMETGLARDDHTGTVKMLITYVHDLPNGTEQGQFLALDLGEHWACLALFFPVSAGSERVMEEELHVTNGLQELD